LICDTQVFEIGSGGRVRQIYQFDDYNFACGYAFPGGKYLLFGHYLFAGVSCFEYDGLRKTYAIKGITCFRCQKYHTVK
jgi:hypothetical protein